METKETVVFKKVLCVILHYANEADTYQCLESLASESNLEIVVVDNDPAQNFGHLGPSPHTYSIVRTGGRMGFAEANNYGVTSSKKAHHEQILILNNDIVAQPGAIDILHRTLEDPTVGIAGPTILFFDSPHRIWANGGKISRLSVTINGIRKAGVLGVKDVDYIPGAAFMTRMDIWENLGGLSERFFLAYEEAHFALEAKRIGFRVVVNQSAVILHKVGMSSDRQPKYFYNTVRNRMRFGEYLFSSQIGQVWGAISGLFRSKSILRLRLWRHAVVDEINGRPLDREALERIDDIFGSRRNV